MSIKFFEFEFEVITVIIGPNMGEKKMLLIEEKK